MRIIGTPPDQLIPVFDLRVTREDLDAVADTLRSGWLTMGPRTQQFEIAFAEAIGARHGIAVANCTAALHLANLAVGLGPGDEVIVPSFTMVATAAAVLYAGATPVFADIVGIHEPLIDPDHVETLLTDRTKAIVAMHFGGYGAAVARLAELCRERGIALIEDAAHSPLASIGGRALGTWGLVGTFSFFSNKVLFAGEGGLLATDNDEIAAFARSRRSHAMTTGSWRRHHDGPSRYDVPALGFNYRIDEPRAALLLSRLPRLKDEIVRRRIITRRYRRLLSEIPGLVVPFTDESVETSSCYVMPVMVEDSSRQGQIRQVLREVHGVQTSIFYPAIHEFTAYRSRFPGLSLPLTELAARSEITLPLFPHLTETQQDRVVDALSAELTA
jgi:dTDP-4-amino-4,6-dideoxygalactose transaminase